MVLGQFAMTGFMFWHSVMGTATPPSPTPAPATYNQTFVKLGAEYAKPLVDTYADSWDAFGDAVGGTASVTEALGDLASKWKSDRSVFYGKSIAPEMEKIYSSKSVDQMTSVQRAAMKEAGHSLAHGIRGGK